MMFDDHRFRTLIGDLVPQTAEKATSTNSGELPTYRRRSVEVPTDAPPEKVRLTLRAEVEYGLRDVCGNWPTGEFDRIVADVTATAMKYHGRERRGKKPVSFLAKATRIPGAAPVIAAVMAAVNSVQRFLQLERLPLN
jgi:hypothetical protein